MGNATGCGCKGGKSLDIRHRREKNYAKLRAEAPTDEYIMGQKWDEDNLKKNAFEIVEIKFPDNKVDMHVSGNVVTTVLYGGKAEEKKIEVGWTLMEINGRYVKYDTSKKRIKKKLAKKGSDGNLTIKFNKNVFKKGYKLKRITFDPDANLEDYAIIDENDRITYVLPLGKIKHLQVGWQYLPTLSGEKTRDGKWSFVRIFPSLQTLDYLMAAVLNQMQKYMHITPKDSEERKTLPGYRMKYEDFKRFLQKEIDFHQKTTAEAIKQEDAWNKKNNYIKSEIEYELKKRQEKIDEETSNSKKDKVDETELNLSSRLFTDQHVIELIPLIDTGGLSAKITTLLLRDNGIGDEGAKHLSNGVLKCPNLNMLDLKRNVIDSNGAKEIAEMMKKHPALKKLYLQGNKIGPEGAAAIGSALKSSKLEIINLNFEFNIPSFEKNPYKTPDDVKNKKGEAIKDNYFRVVDHLVDNNDAIILGFLLKKNCTINDFSLAANNIGAEGISYILTSNPSLTRAVFENNSDLGPGISKIELGNLTWISLDGCGCTDEGAIGLAKGLSEEKNKLEHLGLSRNQIGNDGAKSLMDALVENKNTRLSSLSLLSNKIEIVGASAIANMLENNTSLKSLLLNNNPFAEEGSIKILKSLKQNKSLTKLFLKTMKITDNGFEGVKDILENREGTLVLGLGKNDGKNFPDKIGNVTVNLK